MSLRECIENLVNVTKRGPEFFINYLANGTYFCAGSFPTNIGVNMCRVNLLRWYYSSSRLISNSAEVLIITTQVWLI